MRRLLAERWSRRPEERGAITLAVTLLAVGFLILGGLVIDGGRQMNAKIRARAVAEEAARAGASKTNINVADPELIVDDVMVGVADYCQLAQENDPTITDCHYTGNGDYTGGGVNGRAFPWVEVSVTVKSDTILMGLIGVGSMESTVTARANAVEGVEDPLHDPGLQTLDPTVTHPTVTPTFPTVTDTEPPTSDPPPDTYEAGDPPCESKETGVPTDSTVTCDTTVSSDVPTTTSGPVPNENWPGCLPPPGPKRPKQAPENPPPPPACQSTTMTTDSPTTTDVTETGTTTIPTSPPYTPPNY